MRGNTIVQRSDFSQIKVVEKVTTKVAKTVVLMPVNDNHFEDKTGTLEHANLYIFSSPKLYMTLKSKY